MSATSQFDQLANRRQDHSRKWDRKYVEEKYGPLPDNYISMWVADMDFEMPPILEKGLIEVINHKSVGYTYVYDEFLEAIQYWIQLKTGIKVHQNEILLDYSVSIALYHAVQAFCHKGDCIMVQNPVYNPFRMAAIDNGVRVIENNLIIDDNFRYQMDFTEIEEQIKTCKPKVFILCSPHNPGGRVWSLNELEQLAEICLKYQVVLISDEVHSDHINKEPFTSCLQLSTKYRENLVLFASPNKGFNMAGLKTSYAIISNLLLREQFEQVLVTNHLLEPNIFGAAALTSVYSTEGAQWLKESYQYILENYQWVQQFCKENLSNYPFMEMESSYLLWWDIRESGLTSQEFVNRLAQEAGILLKSGSDFGTAGEGFVRINIGTSRANIIEAFNRMANWLEKIQKEHF